VCGAETFTLNDAQDYGIRDNWQKAFAKFTCVNVAQW
jgi:hypothetical protein